jgi:hypothetical protein
MYQRTTIGRSRRASAIPASCGYKIRYKLAILTPKKRFIFLLTRDFSVTLKSLSGKNGCYQLANSEDGQTCPKNPINAVCSSLEEQKVFQQPASFCRGLEKRAVVSETPTSADGSQEV